jgi:hypothetical protein
MIQWENAAILWQIEIEVRGGEKMNWKGLLFGIFFLLLAMWIGPYVNIVGGLCLAAVGFISIWASFKD